MTADAAGFPLLPCTACHYIFLPEHTTGSTGIDDQCASSQFFPMPTSAISGTLSSATPRISSGTFC